MCPTGQPLTCSNLNPEKLAGSKEYIISAKLIRDILRGGVENADPHGIRLIGARITDGLDLEDMYCSVGLTLTRCWLDQPIIARNANVPWLSLSDSYVPALNAFGLHVGGSLQLNRLRKGRRSTAHTEGAAVRLYGAQIGGNLYCKGAELDSANGPALGASRLRVDGSAHLQQLCATAHGTSAAVELRGARIGTSLEFGNDRLRNSHGPVLDLRAASLNTLNLPADITRQSGEKICRQQFFDGVLVLDGLTYDSVPSGADLNQWLDWLHKSTPTYATQPYQQLAAVHRAAGHEAEARRILVAQQDDLRARGYLGGRWATARHHLLGVTIGYGYRTWRAFVGLAIVLILAIGLGLLAGHIHRDGRWVAAHPGKVGTACSTVEQIGLGVGRAIPLIISDAVAGNRCELDSTDVTGQIIFAIGWILQLSAWALATLAIAGYSSLVRKG